MEREGGRGRERGERGVRRGEGGERWGADRGGEERK